MATIYEVGGCVRDKLLGLKPKDIDYVFTLSQEEAAQCETAHDGFAMMELWLQAQGFQIFLKNPDCYTIRSKFPNSNEVADFVLARKEVGYEVGSRKPKCIPGTLFDDLERRDFTVNAMASDEKASCYDFFNSRQHLKEKILHTPKPTKVTFDEDPLRVLRALRFVITHSFSLSEEIQDCLINYDFAEKMHVVSAERIREELHKMFAKDSFASLQILQKHERLSNYIFNKTNIRLLPTFKQF